MNWMRRWPADHEVALIAAGLTIGLLIGGVVALQLIHTEAQAQPMAEQVQPSAVPALPLPTLKPLAEAPLRVRTLPRLEIPGIGVNADMEPVGLTTNGAMGIPSGGDVVAWYSLGPFPGSPGNAVLAGHVDWQLHQAVFWGLKALKPGDRIFLNFGNDARLSYTVSWVEQYRLSTAPLARIFQDSVSSALTLITCGGVFDSQTRQYNDRLVLRAVRA